MSVSIESIGTGLPPGATIAVLGGGPAGSFFGLHLLRRAKELRKDVRLLIIERRLQTGPALPGLGAGRWRGCNYCAGGISPRTSDVLDALDLRPPPDVIQGHVRSIIVEGYWKNIELEVPPDRQMFSVYRGSCPARPGHLYGSFDAFLLGAALKAGAELISGEVSEVRYGAGGRLLVHYQSLGSQLSREADFVVFAAGVNEVLGQAGMESPMVGMLRGLIPDFEPPRLRRALICELQGEPEIPARLEGTLHFLEYGSDTLNLEMCSLVPKHGFLTAVLVGSSVDAAASRGHNGEIINRFLALPQLRKLLAPGARFHSACSCSPNMVIGSARNPFGDRIACVGDLVTARLYKDGILSAQQTARALAETLLTLGIDAGSLRRGYGPTLDHFRRDNRFAALVFLLHRLCFSSSVMSRVLYQAVITERKTRSRANRGLEEILWQIASGDADYKRIFLTIARPATVWSVLTGGLAVTLRNYLTELVFGLRWEGFGRFTTGVAKEHLESKRSTFARLMAEHHIAVSDPLEFERMYAIRIHAPVSSIIKHLGQFGETNRAFLRPRWVRIERTAGQPNLPGCVICYRILGGVFSFRLELERGEADHLLVYRVKSGFAEGGVLLFEVEPTAPATCSLSIYVAFNFARGRTWAAGAFWFLFRTLFPSFVHDVIWNHSLCQLKDVVEQGPSPD